MERPPPRRYMKRDNGTDADDGQCDGKRVGRVLTSQHDFRQLRAETVDDNETRMPECKDNEDNKADEVNVPGELSI